MNLLLIAPLTITILMQVIILGIASGIGKEPVRADLFMIAVLSFFATAFALKASSYLIDTSNGGEFIFITAVSLAISAVMYRLGRRKGRKTE